MKTLLTSAVMMVKSLGPVVLTAAGACTPEVEHAVVITTDSSGISVIENGQVDVFSASRWLMSDSPVLRIGTADGPDEYQFYQISDAFRGADGRIHVLNQSTGELRIYLRDGTFERALGRIGSGPGEFRRPSHAWLLPGDSIMIWDDPMGPWVVFSPDGVLAHTRAVDRAQLMASLKPGEFTETVQPLPDGTLIAAASSPNDDGPIAPDEVYRPDFRLVLIPPTMTRSVELGTYGGLEQALTSIGGRRVPVVVLFSPRYQIVIGGTPQRIALSDGDRPEIGLFDTQGRPLQVIRWEPERREISASDRDMLRRMTLDRNPDSRRILEERLARAPERQFLPTHGAIRIDAQGNVWVAEYAPLPHSAHRWIIFDTDGRLLAALESPENTVIREIGEDYILAIERDQSEVEYVVLYDLIKTEPE